MAEFSFDYDMPAREKDGKNSAEHEPKKARLEEFPAEVVGGANRLFRFRTENIPAAPKLSLLMRKG